MGRCIVLTGVGRDRVGIVSELTDLLYRCGCNLTDSSMTLLHGQFAIILMVEPPEGLSLDDLEQRLASLESRMGIHFYARQLSEEEAAAQDVVQNLHMISVYGADRPGIVCGITRKLANLGVNVTDVQTKTLGEGSRPVFVMLLEAAAPEELTTDNLEAELTQVSRDLNVDISVRALDDAEL